MRKNLLTRFLLSAFLLSAASTAFAEQQQALTVNLTDGTKIVYRLESKPRLTFAGQKMNIASDDGSRSLEMENVANWTVGLAESGVTKINNAATTIDVNGNMIDVSLSETGSIRIFSLDGNLLAASQSDSLHFETSAPGIYIITINNNSYKIIIR